MSKINKSETIEVAEITPTIGFGQHTPLEVGSTKTWFGKLPKGDNGWTDKSRACLGLGNDTNICWAPVYMDSLADYTQFTAFAHSQGLSSDVLGAKIVREWFYKNYDAIEEVVGAYHKETVTVESAKSKMEAALRAADKYKKMMEDLSK